MAGFLCFFGLVLEAQFCNCFVFLEFSPIAQAVAHVIQVTLDRLSRGHWVAGLDTVIYRFVLIQKNVARRAMPEHDLAVVKHTAVQQLEHRSHHVQHNHVVTCFDNRQMKLRIQTRLIIRIAFGVGRLHLAKGLRLSEDGKGPVPIH